jgi:hypothetical protein
MSGFGLKTIEHAGGLLAFRVPERWSERTEEDGASLYYCDGAEDGMLRVKVMTFTSQQRLEEGVALAELEAMTPEPGQTLERLPNGNALRAHREENRGESESTVLHIWMLASIEPPHRMRLAVFSFTHLLGRAADETVRRTVETLDREIRGARFAHQLS